MSNKELKVESELYREMISDNVTTLQNSNSLMKLTFKCMPSLIRSKEPDVSVDCDGDLLVCRINTYVIILEHSLSTTISLVGLQLWRGALVLADYILFNGLSMFRGKTVLELGTGIGLSSIIGGLFAKEIISTDVPFGGILDLIKRNFERNSDIIKASVSVIPLDFYNIHWSKELAEKVEAADIFLAADVIYDNELTEAFISTLTKILSSQEEKTVFVTLEKRYVFTISELDSVAPCYEHFLESVKKVWSRPPMSTWSLRLLDLDFPQYFDYERTRHIVFWQIKNF